MNDPVNENPDFLQSIRWPLIVIALLVGHVTLMMVAMSIALAEVNDVIPVVRPGATHQSAESHQDQTQ
jgi:hypothetical protein